MSGEAVAGDRLVVAIDPGKVESRVWLSNGERGLLAEPLSLPTSRAGLAALEDLVEHAGGAPLIALEQVAGYWASRWKTLLPPPADAPARARRLGADLDRLRALQGDIAELDRQIAELLGETAGQVLLSLPGVSTIRAATFAAFTLPVERFPSAEHLYAATGLAPAAYQSSTVTKRGAIRRSGLPSIATR